jgi:hypothetical protein
MRQTCDGRGTGAKEPVMQSVQYVCIENVALKFGTANEMLRRAESGVLPLYRSQPGFASFAVAKIGEASVIGFSVWHSQEQAEKAAQTWRGWVQEYAAQLVESTQHHIGELGFCAAAGDLSTDTRAAPATVPPVPTVRTARDRMRPH